MTPKTGPSTPSADAPVQPVDRFSRLKPVLKVVVPLLLFLAAVVTLAGGWQQLSSQHLEIRLTTAAAAFVVLLVAIVWASIVWTYMARAFGAPLGWGAGVKVYATS